MGYKIIQDSDDSETNIIYFDNIYIGDIYKEDIGFKVCPSWGAHSGFFHTFDTACIELVFHYFTHIKQKNIVMC